MDSSSRNWPPILALNLLHILTILSFSLAQSTPPSSVAGLRFLQRRLPVVRLHHRSPRSKTRPSSPTGSSRCSTTDSTISSRGGFVGFTNNEYLVSASNAVLADGGSIPGSVGNGTVFAGYPMTDLKTAVKTAGDLTQMQVQVKLTGTQFGVAPPKVPMPSNLTLANDGFVCPLAAMQECLGLKISATSWMT
ncbi:unnamed protein product [Malus baccata var. baccata]